MARKEQPFSPASVQAIRKTAGLRFNGIQVNNIIYQDNTDKQHIIYKVVKDGLTVFSSDFTLLFNIGANIDAVYVERISSDTPGVVVPYGWSWLSYSNQARKWKVTSYHGDVLRVTYVPARGYHIKGTKTFDIIIDGNQPDTYTAEAELDALDRPTITVTENLFQLDVLVENRNKYKLTDCKAVFETIWEYPGYGEYVQKTVTINEYFDLPDSGSKKFSLTKQDLCTYIYGEKAWWPLRAFIWRIHKYKVTLSGNLPDGKKFSFSKSKTLTDDTPVFTNPVVRDSIYRTSANFSGSSSILKAQIENTSNVGVNGFVEFKITMGHLNFFGQIDNTWTNTYRYSLQVYKGNSVVKEQPFDTPWNNVLVKYVITTVWNLPDGSKKTTTKSRTFR